MSLGPLRLALLSLLAAVSVAAQSGGPGFSIPGYNEIQNNKTPVLPRRRRLNFVNGGCVDDVANASTDCTVSGSGGGAPVGAEYIVQACDPTLTAEERLIAGPGIASVEVAGDCGTLTLATASQEASFLANGVATALTCGGSQGAGSEQVRSDRTLEWCDGAGTPHLRSVGASIFNVRDYGATGVAADDGPAIQAAADAAAAGGGGIVQLDCATYTIQQAVKLDDFVTLQGRGRCSILKRGATAFAEPAYDPTDGTCTTTVAPESFRNAIRNLRKDCRGTALTIRDLAIDGSLITSMPCTSCTAGPTTPSVMINLSAVTDLTIERVYIVNAPQDAIFVKNGGPRTTIRHITIDGHDMLWGNGSGINVEMRTTGNLPGTPLFADNVVISRGPDFCDNDLHVTCAADVDCAGVGGICGNGAGASGVNGISFTWAQDAAQAPSGLITRNRIETTDRHTGINVSGASGMHIAENRITGFNSGTALSQVFLGIQVTAASSGLRPHDAVVIADNVILGNNVANDKRGILVDDASSSSRRTIVQGNVVRNKSLQSGSEGITVRGISDGVISGNIIQNITASHGLGIGGTTPATTSDLQVTGNVISDVTAGSADCVAIRNAMRTRVASNTFRNCARGVEFLSATVSGTILAGNTYATVTTPLNQNVTDATLFLDEPSIAFTAAGLPSTAQDGSRTYCSNCGSSNPCAVGSGSYLALHLNGAWTCDGFTTGAGSANRVAFWNSASNLTFNSGFSFNGSSLAFSTLRSFIGSSPLHLEFGGTSEIGIFDVYNAGPQGPQLVGRHAHGSPGSETSLSQNDVLFTLSGRGWAGAAFSGSAAKVEGFATDVAGWSAGVDGARVDISTTPNGGTATALVCRHDQDGTTYLVGSSAGAAPPGGGSFRTVSKSPDAVRNLYLDGSTPLVFDGATTTGTTNRTSVAVTDPTGARTLTVPDANSVTVQPLDCTPSQVVGKVNADGSIGCAGTASAFFGNPTALVGLSAVNGSATTAMRSDAAPALDQSIAPTWTGLHKFSAGADLVQNALIVELPNDGTTATVLNKPAVMTATGTVRVSGTADKTGLIGIVVGGAGTTGSAQIAREGHAQCVFPTATTAGDYVQNSGIFAGDCVDAGSSIPTSSGQILGRVLDSGAAGLHTVELTPGGEPSYALTPAAGAGAAALVTSARQVIPTAAQILVNGSQSAQDLTGNVTLAYDYSTNPSGSPALSAGQCVWTNVTVGANKGGFVCEGATADANETYIGVAEPTNDLNTITFPDASGTVTVSSSQTNNALVKYSGTGGQVAPAGCTESANLISGCNLSGTATGLNCTGCVGPTEIASRAVVAGSYGSSSLIPVITVDADGRLTAASTVAVVSGFPSSHGISTLGIVAVNTTTYMAESVVDPLESHAQQYVNSTRTVGGFGCVNPVTQGTGTNHDIVVTLDTSACVTGTSNLTASTRTCTLTGAASGPQTCTSVNGPIVVTAANCMAFKVTTQSAVAAAAVVNCTYDYTG